MAPDTPDSVLHMLALTMDGLVRFGLKGAALHLSEVDITFAFILPRIPQALLFSELDGFLEGVFPDGASASDDESE